MLRFQELENGTTASSCTSNACGVYCRQGVENLGCRLREDIARVWEEDGEGNIIETWELHD